MADNKKTSVSVIGVVLLAGICLAMMILNGLTLLGAGHGTYAYFYASVLYAIAFPCLIWLGFVESELPFLAVLVALATMLTIFRFTDREYITATWRYAATFWWPFFIVLHIVLVWHFRSHRPLKNCAKGDSQDHREVRS